MLSSPFCKSLVKILNKQGLNKVPSNRRSQITALEGWAKTYILDLFIIQGNSHFSSLCTICINLHTRISHEPCFLLLSSQFKGIKKEEEEFHAAPQVASVPWYFQFFTWTNCRNLIEITVAGKRSRLVYGHCKTCFSFFLTFISKQIRPASLTSSFVDQFTNVPFKKKKT